MNTSSHRFAIISLTLLAAGTGALYLATTTIQSKAPQVEPAEMEMTPSGDTKAPAMNAMPTPETTMIEPGLERAKASSLDGLTPRERATQFLALAQEDQEAAAALLESSAPWLEYEREGLAAVLFEEVLRQRESAEIADWLDRIAGKPGSREGMLEYLLDEALATNGLIADPLAFLEVLSQDARPELAQAGQLASMLHVFKTDGFANAIAQGQAFGVTADTDDPQFEALIGRALQSEPSKVLTWLQNESEDTELTKFYLPFALSQWSWKDGDGAADWLESFDSSPLRDRLNQG